MSRLGLTVTATLAGAIIIGALASAPAEQRQKQTAPKGYKTVSVTAPKPFNDAGFEAFRKQLGTIAEKKDRAALGRLIAANFFWIPQDKDVADKRKSGIDNLSKAIGLEGRNPQGWDALAEYAQEPTAEPDPDHNGVMCAPAGPVFDEKALEELVKSTNTNPGEWAWPAMDGVQVRAGAAANSAPTEKLGMHLVRIYEDESSQSQDSIRIVTPSGKAGFVSADSIMPLGGDQLCYVKDGNAWKIAGVNGGMQ